MKKQVVQVGMCPVTNWPQDYNWSDTDKHKCYGGYWEKYSGVGGIGDEIAMRMFFQPYTQYRAIKEKYPHLYFRHYSLLHPRDYDSNPLFNADSILSLYEHNPYIDEISYIQRSWIVETDYYKAMEASFTNETEEFQGFLRCLDRFMAELRRENNEAALEEIIEGENFVEDEPCMYIDDENIKYAQELIKDLPKPLIGIQVNKSANNIIEFLPTIRGILREQISEGTIVCIGTTFVPKRWLEDDMVSFSGTTNLLQGIALIDILDVFFCMFSGLMYSAFIRKVPTVTWAEQEKDDNGLGHVSWYSKKLKLNLDKHKFVIGDTVNIYNVVNNVVDILRL